MLLPEARRANTKKHQVTLTYIGDALFCTGGDIHDVQRLHFHRRRITDPDPARTLENNVALNRISQHVQSCCDTWLHACPCYGTGFIRICIVKLSDITALFCIKFSVYPEVLYVFQGHCTYRSGLLSIVQIPLSFFTAIFALHCSHDECFRRLNIPNSTGHFEYNNEISGEQADTAPESTARKRKWNVTTREKRLGRDIRLAGLQESFLRYALLFLSLNRHSGIAHFSAFDRYGYPGLNARH